MNRLEYGKRFCELSYDENEACLREWILALRCRCATPGTGGSKSPLRNQPIYLTRQCRRPRARTASRLSKGRSNRNLRSSSVAGGRHRYFSDPNGWLSFRSRLGCRAHCLARPAQQGSFSVGEPNAPTQRLALLLAERDLVDHWLRPAVAGRPQHWHRQGDDVGAVGSPVKCPSRRRRPQ